MATDEGYERAISPVASSPSPFFLGSPILAASEDDGMDLSPLLGSAGMGEELLLSPVLHQSTGLLSVTSPSFIPMEVDEGVSHTPTPALATPEIDLSPIFGATVLEHAPRSPPLRLASGVSHSVLPPPDSPPPSAHQSPPDGARPSTRSLPPDGSRPPARGHPSVDIGADRPESSRTTTCINPPKVRRARENQQPSAMSQVFNHPAESCTSEGGSLASLYDESAHARVLDGAKVLKEHTSSRLGYLQVERGAWISALEACQEFNMHCATIDWIQTGCALLLLIRDHARGAQYRAYKPSGKQYRSSGKAMGFPLSQNRLVSIYMGYLYTLKHPDMKRLNH
ncbi:hypothetical protein C8T65DRAFT_699345 [Cerioporus squamosus]|nr:hypothetical protein C8T65DRAFT_699345 [Cerioporus squamosus]